LGFSVRQRQVVSFTWPYVMGRQNHAGYSGDEVAYFLEWVDFAANGVQPLVAPVTDQGLTFPDFFTDKLLIYLPPIARTRNGPAPLWLERKAGTIPGRSELSGG